MKTRLSFFIAVAILTALTAASDAIKTKTPFKTYSSLWTQIEKAREHDLPETVISLCDIIVRKAEDDGNIGQKLKALAYKAGYGSYRNFIKELEAMAGKSTDIVENMTIHSLLASAYANIALNQSRELGRRTDISAEKRPDDMSEWGAAMFYSKVMEEISASLSDMDTLMKARSGQFEPMTDEGWAGIYYNNDMLHVIAFENLHTLDRIIRIADDENEVLAFKKSLYDAVLSSYTESDNKNAVLLWSTERLRFIYRIDDNAADFAKELDKLIASYGDNELVCEPLYEKVLMLEREGNLTGALDICDSAIKRFPKYKRIGLFKDTRKNLTGAILSVTIPETAYPGETVKLKVTHRNISGFDFSIYTATDEVFAKVLAAENKDLAEYIKAKCIKTESMHLSLEPTPDLKTKESEVEIKVPDIGCYLITLNGDGITDKCSKLIVSRLAVLTMATDGRLDAIVVDRKSGNPVSEAKVTLSSDDYNAGRKTVGNGITDSEGRISFPIKDLKNSYGIRIHAALGKDKWLAKTYVNLYDRSQYTPDNKSRDHLSLFTDRALYRPGQTVHVCGIAYSQSGDITRASADKTISITLMDANWQKIETKVCRTNDMGSFHTKFVIPDSGLNGVYTLKTNNTSVSFRVEEYKRPTFEVTVETPEGSFRLGDTVIIKGKAETFSGAPLAGAKGKYSIDVSEWSLWRLNNRKTLKTGEITVDAYGNFEIPLFLDGDALRHRTVAPYEYASGTFALKESSYAGNDDRAVPKHYNFKVDVDITDAAGETAAGSTVVAAGNKPLVLEYSGSAMLDKNRLTKVRISAFNLLRKPVDCKIGYILWAIRNNERTGIAEKGSVRSGTPLNTKNWSALESGLYELEYYTVCAYGLRCEGAQRITLFSTSDTRPATETPLWLYSDNGKVYYGTSAKNATIFMDKFVSGKKTESINIPISDSIAVLDFRYKEEYGDGATLGFCIVRDGRIYRKSVSVEKPKPQKGLRLNWSVFRDKVHPGEKEEWRLRITDKDNRPADAEMFAYMYDASLDNITDHPFSFALAFRRDNRYNNWDFRNPDFLTIGNPSPVIYGERVDLTHDRFTRIPAYLRLLEPTRAYNLMASGKLAMLGRNTDAEMVASGAEDDMEEERGEESYGGGNVPEFIPRSNFSETAFFYPRLRTDRKGEVSIAFTLPESLTKWKFRSLAHTKELHFGLLEEVVTAQKDFMLQPNMPRFLRTGDMACFAAKLSNLSDVNTDATVVFELFDPATEDVFERQSRRVSVKAKGNASVSFDYKATGKYGVIGVRMVAQGESFSDGEQHLLAVLSDRVSLVESVALPFSGNGKKSFPLETLFNNHSTTATDRRLTVEFAANPSWFAIQALPNLAQPENDCVTDWANALYANSLAKHIAESSSAIRNVFESWKKSDSVKEVLAGSLQKNSELRNILLNETPWVCEAKDEASRIAEISDLFDKANIKNREKTALGKLSQLQNSDGGWSWFKGMTSSPWMTGYLLTLNARLALLTGERVTDGNGDMYERGFMFMHKAAEEHYERIMAMKRRHNFKEEGVDYFTLRYLYLVSLDALSRNIADSKKRVPAEYRKMYGYFLGKAAESPASKNIQEKAMTAVILHCAGKDRLAARYMESISEHLTETEECGMFFDFDENPWNFGQMDINAHVAAMEAFDIVSKDTATVDKMKLWLLKQKQTRTWKTGVMTADAVYAIIRRGTDRLANSGEARLSIGGDTLCTSGNGSVTGLGYIKKDYTDSKILDSRMISVDNNSGGAAWGAVYARFSENIRDVAVNGGKEMGIEKELYVKRRKSGGSMAYELVPIGKETRVEVGEIVTARIVMRVDRNMDFVMIKEHRAACMEPLDQISGYRFNGKTGFYEEIRDASTNLFFDSVKKGKYVIEIDYRVSRTGRYEAGLATLQCAYAPEFSAHSGSVSIEVR